MITVSTQVRLVPLNGKGNVNGNRTTVDQLIKNEDGSYTIIETKLRDTTPLSPGQKAAKKHIGTEGGVFEVRSDINELNLKKGDIINVREYIRKNKYNK